MANPRARERHFVFLMAAAALVVAAVGATRPAGAEPEVPSISGFSPQQGQVGTQVAVSGTDFTDATDLQFGEVDATFTVTDDSDITTTVPFGAATGPISVVTPDGTATSTDRFTVLGTPSVTGFSPQQGQVGSQVAVTGSDFTDASDVQFADVSAQFTVADDGDLTATVPAGAVTGLITVVTPDGTATSTDPFTVIGTPTVTGFSPQQGQAGTEVAVTGSDFTDASDVQFGGVSASFTVSDDSDITATVPFGAASGPISVVTPDGTATSTDAFTVVGTPSVTVFSPQQGAGGTQVTISGTNFTGANDVQFGGVSASFTVTDDSDITATVPFGAASGPITVATADGTAVSTGQFLFIPIQHIVIVDEENHSFDDMLGKLCVDDARGLLTRAGLNDPCDGTDEGELPGGTKFPLTEEPNGGLNVDHSVRGQQLAMDGGQMDGFDKITGCRPTGTHPYGCFSQYDPLQGPCGLSGTETCIPNIVSWAEHFALSDRTFEFASTPSWAGHMVLGDAALENFIGTNPHKKGVALKRYLGWGCDSGKLTGWLQPGQPAVQVPPCIPDRSGNMGPTWAGTPFINGAHAQYTPTIFDRMDSGHISWRIYGGGGRIGPHGSAAGGYGWTICPTFWECLGSSQVLNLVPNSQFASDAAAGRLPAVSFVTPISTYSTHQPAMASVGDNWLASQVIGPLMNGPDWGTSAVFLTWDDCGCFYDHVAPTFPQWGVRVPMIILGPYARAGYTDSTPATFVSMLAFIEHVYGLPALNPCAGVEAGETGCTDDVRQPDGSPTYDFMHAFDFTQAPLSPTHVFRTPLGAYDRQHLALWSRQANQAT